jgi:hypothetical protein
VVYDLRMGKRVVENLERAAERAHRDGDEARARRLQDKANEVASKDRREAKK